MSIESAQAFIERMKTDGEFANRVTECADAESRKAFVKAEGFDFSAEELKSMHSELSDEELDGVAGGASWDNSQTVGGSGCRLVGGATRPGAPNTYTWNT